MKASAAVLPAMFSATHAYRPESERSAGDIWRVPRLIFTRAELTSRMVSLYHVTLGGGVPVTTQSNATDVPTTTTLLMGGETTVGGTVLEEEQLIT